MLSGKQVAKLCLGLVTAALLLEIYTIYYPNLLSPSPNTITTPRIKRRFAVLGCSTPEKNSHRGFDYVFYLPLTVLAWQRIGFESIILIIGEKREWQVHPILSYVLDNLERQSDATKWKIE
jgi:hypothetical protein